MAKAPPTPAPETFQDLAFPINGLNTQTEFELQPPQTTRECLNVRAYEPITMRLRGGSRPGLSKYIPATVTGLANKVVQHLNIIVDPTEPNLLTMLDNVNASPGGSDPYPYTDPSTNNVTVSSPLQRNPNRGTRTGGSGATQNRYIGRSSLTIFSLVVAKFVSGSGGTYVMAIVPSGAMIMANSLTGTDTEVIGTAAYAVLTGSGWYYYPFLYVPQ